MSLDMNMFWFNPKWNLWLFLTSLFENGSNAMHAHLTFEEFVYIGFQSCSLLYASYIYIIFTISNISMFMIN